MVNDAHDMVARPALHLTRHIKQAEADGITQTAALATGLSLCVAAEEVHAAFAHDSLPSHPHSAAQAPAPPTTDGDSAVTSRQACPQHIIRSSQCAGLLPVACLACVRGQVCLSGLASLAFFPWVQHTGKRGLRKRGLWTI